MAGVEAAWSDLRAIVGVEHMRLASPEDAVDGVQPQMVIEPGSPDEIARVLKTARGAGLQVIPRGGDLGRRSPDQRQPRYDFREVKARDDAVG